MGAPSFRLHSSTMVGKDGGKAKPLKAAKKAEKDYDEGACAAASRVVVTSTFRRRFGAQAKLERRADAPARRFLYDRRPCLPGQEEGGGQGALPAPLHTPKRSVVRHSRRAWLARLLAPARASHRTHGWRAFCRRGTRSGRPGAHAARWFPPQPYAHALHLRSCGAQAMAALKAKASEKGAFGGKGLSYSGKK